MHIRRHPCKQAGVRGPGDGRPHTGDAVGHLSFGQHAAKVRDGLAIPVAVTKVPPVEAVDGNNKQLVMRRWRGLYRLLRTRADTSQHAGSERGREDTKERS